MANGLRLEEVENYVDNVIPRIESDLSDSSKTDEERLELYNLYEEILVLVAPYNFHSFNKYIEFDENHESPNKAFYFHRKDALSEIFDALNDMEIYDKYDMLLVSTPPRVGKFQPLRAKILTPKGWSKMGEIKENDFVIGSDGKPTKVNGVFPQGKQDVYTLTFDDGTTVEAGLDHLWTVRTRDDRKAGVERTVTTGSMIKNLYVEKGKRKNYSIDYVKPVVFKSRLKKGVDLSPYVLGVLLGDGTFRDTSVKFTNIDEDIIERLSLELPETDTLNRISNTISFNITKKNKSLKNEKGRSVPSSTKKQIKLYGLDNKLSSEKFIPQDYLYASIEERTELLRGLMDTDGSVNSSEKSSYCEYSTVSRQLCDDFLELVRGLGGRTTYTTKIGSYKDKNGVKVNCKLSYRIVFNMEINPFYCERKKTKFNPRATRKYKYISSIERTGHEECQCISVDSEKHLYVTDGYNLTHNTTSAIRFMSWIMGRYPEESELGTSYTDNITTSFYIGILEVIDTQRYADVFPDAPLVNQNGKREEIWLKTMKRYPTLTLVPINGSMAGRCEASRYVYCDDLVSGIEEAMSPPRLNKLYQKYSTDVLQRKKDGCKELHVATKWSVHDIITKLGISHADNPRCKIINLPCYDENRESRFNFFGGFSTKYYNDIEKEMDIKSFGALYMCDPIEREGILYNEDELSRYFELPTEKPDTIIGICDSKNLGKDYVTALVGYTYNDTVFIDDVVFNDGLPAITQPLVADMLVRNKAVRTDVELNNGGNYYAEKIQELIKEQSGKTTLRIFFTGNNKQVKIITYSDYAKKHFVFRDKSTYSPNSEYAKFIKALTSWTQSGKNEHDDAPDAVAMLAQLHQELSGFAIKIIDRRTLGL